MYRDTFVRDLALGKTLLVSAEPGNLAGIDDTCAADISADGRYVAFRTGECSHTGQIYVRDRGSLPPPDAPTQLLHVATGGSNVAGCGSATSPCRSIQQAVDNAGCSATVKVAAGTYTDTHTLIDNSDIYYSYVYTQALYLSGLITVTGGYTTANWEISDPAANPVTLDANGQGRVVYAASDYGVTLNGLSLVNGNAQFGGGDNDGGGVLAGSSRFLAIRHCEIISNTANDGGGVYVHNTKIASSVTILEDNTFSGNTIAGNGSGGGISARATTLTMTGNIVQNNTAQFYGGGAEIYECPAYIAGNTFQNNEAHHDGGLSATWGDLILTGNVFLYNKGDGNSSGGGFNGNVAAGRAYTITFNTFKGNVAAAHGGGVGGGASISGEKEGMTVFSHNTLLDNVAAAGRDSGSGGGLDISGPALISDNLFQNNWASTESPHNGYYYGGYGGGLRLGAGGQTLDGNRFINNRAARYSGINYTSEAIGGGAYVGNDGSYSSGSTIAVTMTNNLFVGNVHCEDCAPYDLDEWYRGGGAVAVRDHYYSAPPDNTRLYFYHNTLVNNQSSALRNEYGASVVMSHNIFASHSTDINNVRRYDYSCAETSADYTLWWPAKNVNVDDLDNQCSAPQTSHDFTGDPAFVNPNAGDYHIGRDSAALDRGPGVGVATDMDGNPRPIGTDYDLGADEYSGVDLSTSTKQADPAVISPPAGSGSLPFTLTRSLHYTITLHNSGSLAAPTVHLTDTLPLSLTLTAGPGCAAGTCVYNPATRAITWAGSLNAGATILVTYTTRLSLAVSAGQSLFITNTARLNDGVNAPFNLSAQVAVNPRQIYLPLVLKGR